MRAEFLKNSEGISSKEATKLKLFYFQNFVQWSEMFSNTVYLFKFHFNFKQYVLANYLWKFTTIQQSSKLVNKKNASSEIISIKITIENCNIFKPQRAVQSDI